ncbi:hypothetical protein J3458_020407 [Metarhizium acridum]|uniref:uncharacterized protein n=1 Tax=Metarhizium acridum TaxID=92637 RepID=UPI001C6B73FF|nr:hypothetical protein J3458_020407 [Metarhizium acridum]
MKAFARLLLAATAIAQAMPNGQHGSNQDMVKRSGPLNSLGSRVWLKSGESDSQYDVNQAKDGTPRGFWTIVGPDGVVNTANAHMLRPASPTGRRKAVDASSNGRQDGQQHSTNGQQKAQRPNGQQPGMDQQNRNRTQSNSQRPIPKLEGLQVTFVTVTVRPTVSKGPVKAEKESPRTVTTTVTVSRGAMSQKQPIQPQNPQNSSRKPNAGENPTPNADGNGVGVTTVPIDKTALPTTTYSLNPLMPPSPAPPKPESSSSLPPVPASVAPPKSPQPAAPQPDAQMGSGSSPSSTSSSVPKAPTSLSSGSPEIGGQAPPPTAPLDSAVAPVATSLPGVVAPAQPAVNLSGLTLNSIIDLGNLPKQAGNAPAPTTAAF